MGSQKEVNLKSITKRFSGNERPWPWHIYCKQRTEIGQYDDIHSVCRHSLMDFTDYKRNHPTDCKKIFDRSQKKSSQNRIVLVCENVKLDIRDRKALDTICITVGTITGTKYQILKSPNHRLIRRVCEIAILKSEGDIDETS